MKRRNKTITPETTVMGADLSMRARKAIYKAMEERGYMLPLYGAPGYTQLKEVARLTPCNLLAQKKCNLKTVFEIQQKLIDAGLELTRSFTYDRQQVYVRKGLWKCPYCKSTNLGGGAYHGDWPRVTQLITCKGCQRTWIVVFALAHVIPTEPVLIE